MTLEIEVIDGPVERTSLVRVVNDPTGRLNGYQIVVPLGLSEIFAELTLRVAHTIGYNVPEAAKIVQTRTGHKFDLRRLEAC